MIIARFEIQIVTGPLICNGKLKFIYSEKKTNPVGDSGSKNGLDRVKLTLHMLLEKLNNLIISRRLCNI